MVTAVRYGERGDPGRVRPAGLIPAGRRDPFTVIGILDRRTDEQRHPDTVYARLFVPLSSFSVPPNHGDEVTVDGALYTVFEVLNDPAGGCWLSIREKI